MLVKLANRKIDNLDVKVFDPITRIPVNKDEIIDLDSLPFVKADHYYKSFLAGNMVEATTPVATETATKKNKE